MHYFKEFTFASLLLVSLNASAMTPLPSSSSTSQFTSHKSLTALEAAAPTLSPKVLTLALRAYSKAHAQGYDKKGILSVIDYSLPSSDKSLWVFDLNRNKLLYNTYVAHGRNSGDAVATKFSNNPNSKESSLGLYVTGDTYYGKDGLAMRLNGLSKFNNNAYSRAVVMHGAWYVSQSFLNQNHRLGRSWGCPAVGEDMIKPITNTIKGGTLLFAYGNDSNWLQHETYVAA